MATRLLTSEVYLGQPGSSPWRAIPVDERPLNYAEALSRYRAHKSAEMTIGEDALGAAMERSDRALSRLLDIPAPDLGAVIQKMRIVRAENLGEVPPEESLAILVDLQRLARAA